MPRQGWLIVPYSLRITFYCLNWLIVRFPERIFKFQKQQAHFSTPFMMHLLIVGSSTALVSIYFETSTRYSSTSLGQRALFNQQNVMILYKRVIDSLCYILMPRRRFLITISFTFSILLSLTEVTFRMWQVFYYLTTLTEYLILLIYLSSQ